MSNPSLNPLSDKPTVMVLGANGRLGLAAVRAFAQAGWAVWAQLRRAPRQALPAGVQVVQADALDVATLCAATPQLDVIVHALNPDYTKWARLVPPQTRAVIALAQATGATVMLPGNVYNFGRELPPVLTPTTPMVANHPKAAHRIALETSLAQAAALGVRSIVLRAGDFIGDERTWMDMTLGRKLSAGVFTHMGPEHLTHAWAYLPDLAQAFVRVAERRADLPAHTALHFAGYQLSTGELQTLCAQALGRPLRAAAFPWWLMKLIAPVAAMPRALLEMRHLWTRPHQLDGQSLSALIGPEPHTPPELAVRAALASIPGLRLATAVADSVGSDRSVQQVA